MFKILIVEKNIIQSKYLITYMNNININFKIYGIAYTLNEILDLLLVEDFDLILFDTNIYDKTYTKFFDFLKSKKLVKYEKSIILITDGKINIKENFYINNYLIKPLEQISFNKIIMDFFMNKDKIDITNKIKLELQKLHFKLSYKGTQYLISCVYQAFLLKEKFELNLFRDIFPVVAKEYNKSIDCIYGSIKTAIKSMFCDCKEETLKEYLNCYEIIRPPKPKEIICQILEKINGATEIF